MIKISPKHADFEGIRWATRAVGKKSRRLPLTRLLVRTNDIIGCDGHRLHCYSRSANGPAPGAYEILGNDKKRGIALKRVSSGDGYPNIDVLFPKSVENNYRFPTTGIEDEVGIISVWYAELIRWLKPVVTLNFYYYADIVNVPFPITFYPSQDELGPIYFSNVSEAVIPTGQYSGLIMPRRI